MPTRRTSNFRCESTSVLSASRQPDGIRARGQWNFNWEDLDEVKISSVEIPSANISLNLKEPDKIDLQILAELQANANLSVSKMAESLKVSEDIAYYHFREHVKKRSMAGQHVVG